MPPPFPPTGDNSVVQGQTTYVSFPDGFQLETPNPITDPDNPPIAITPQPEIGAYYYTYLFANVDGVLTSTTSLEPQGFAACFYRQHPWNPGIGGGGDVAPWYVFAYDAVTGAWLNPSGLLSADPAADAVAGPYGVAHVPPPANPPTIDCLTVTPPQPPTGIRVIRPIVRDFAVTVTAARTGDVDQPTSPQAGATYQPSFSWFVIPNVLELFSLSERDYVIGAPTTTPLGGSIALSGASGGIVIASWGLTETMANDCASLLAQLTRAQSFLADAVKTYNDTPQSVPPNQVPSPKGLAEQVAQGAAQSVNRIMSEMAANMPPCPGYAGYPGAPVFVTPV